MYRVPYTTQLYLVIWGDSIHFLHFWFFVHCLVRRPVWHSGQLSKKAISANCNHHPVLPSIMIMLESACQPFCLPSSPSSFSQFHTNSSSTDTDPLFHYLCCPMLSSLCLPLPAERFYILPADVAFIFCITRVNVYFRT